LWHDVIMENEEDKRKMPKYPPKEKMGRPVELTPEVQEIIVKKLKRGNYFETACSAAGINPSTGYRWLKAGSRGEGDIFVNFCKAVEIAEAEAEDNDLLGIEAAGHGMPAVFSQSGEVLRAEVKRDWRALAWRLERRHPKRWGYTQKNEVTGKDGGPLTFVEFIKAAEESKKEEE